MPEEHLDRFRSLFEWIKGPGLKLKPSKCEIFFKWRLTYLGHVVSDKGIQTTPNKMEEIWQCNWLFMRKGFFIIRLK